jgi:hypothetical protein
MKNITIPAIVAMAFVLPGCNILGPALYFLIPGGRTQTVSAECNALSGETVAIIVHASYEVRSDFPAAAREVAFTVAQELREHVRGVTVIDPDRVVAYQHRRDDWQMQKKTELGRAFGARYVLCIDLTELSTQEYGDYNVFRGRLSAEACVYDTAKDEAEARIWPGEGHPSGRFHVVFPPDHPIGRLSDDDRAIRYQTQRLFALQLVRKFYKHKVPVEQ